jgi:nucleotide-binding universal stress UspA family protein
MNVVLAVSSGSRYREAVGQFSEEMASLLEGKVRVASIGSPTEEGPLPERREGPQVAQEAVWLGPDPTRSIVRELAQCDLGVIGRTLEPGLADGTTVGSDVLRLQQLVTRPLAIVPETVRPVRTALFVYTEHPESGHALALAGPLSDKGVAVKLVTLIPALGRMELAGAGEGYLKAHGIPHEVVEAECENCAAEGGPVGEVLHLVRQEQIDLIVLGGTRRGLLGRLLWPELANEVVWNADVPVLVWH